MILNTENKKDHHKRGPKWFIICKGGACKAIHANAKHAEIPCKNELIQSHTSTAVKVSHSIAGGNAIQHFYSY